MRFALYGVRFMLIVNFMDMKEKTYVAPGLREFRLMLASDGVTVTVCFAGGRSTGYAVRPASFTTSDGCLQHLIEKSREFASGKIKLLS